MTTCFNCAYCVDGLSRDQNDNICCVCIKMPSNNPSGCGYMEIEGIDRTKERMWFCPLKEPVITNSAEPAEKEYLNIKKYECLVKSNQITEKIIRYFTSSEHALAWLELEGYRVISIKELV